MGRRDIKSLSRRTFLDRTLKTSLTPSLIGVFINSGLLSRQANAESNGEYLPLLPHHLRVKEYLHLKIRSQFAYENGLSGSWPEQMIHAADRSLSNPNHILMGQDVSTFWKSTDGGRSWHHVKGKGLKVRYSVSVKFHPQRENEVLALMSAGKGAGQNGGIYKSNDGGETWQFRKPMNRVTSASRPNLGIGDNGFHRHCRFLISYNPNNPEIVYCLNPYDGLYRSRNGGDDWQKISSDPKNKGMGRVFKIEVHPQKPHVIYAACENGLFISTTEGQIFRKAQAQGLPTGGQNWITSLDVNPFNGDDIYLVSLYRGLYRSLNAGRNVNAVKYDNKAGQVFVHRTDRSVMYIVRQSGSSTITSNNRGGSWQKIVVKANNLGWELDGWKQRIGFGGKQDNSMQTVLLLHPTNKNNAVASGSATIFMTENRLIWKNSSNGFCNLAWGHGNTGNIAFDHSDKNRFMFFCFDEGAFLTENGGRYFQQRNSGPLDTGKGGQYSGSFCPGQPNKIVSTVGMYSNVASLAISTNGGKSWRAPLSNGKQRKITWSSWHPQRANVVYCDTHRSTDGGNSFQNLSDFSTGLPAGGKLIGCAPSNGDIVYAMDKNGRKIYRSNDKGSHFFLYVNVSVKMVQLQKASSFLIHPTNPNIVFFPNSGKGVDAYNGNKIWNMGLDGKNISCFRVDPRYPTVMYAFSRATGRDCLWRTVNQGESWENISHNLPLTQANNAIEVHPLTGDLFVGGTVGTRILPPPYFSSNSLVKNLGNIQSSS